MKHVRLTCAILARWWTDRHCLGAAVRRSGGCRPRPPANLYPRVVYRQRDRQPGISHCDRRRDGQRCAFQGRPARHPVPVLLAGLDYGTPWTRDASINAWNGASLMMPEVCRNTLLSVLMRSNGKVRIGGQYWDAVVWTTGAWHHYLYTGERQFLALAFEATNNSLAEFQRRSSTPRTAFSAGRPGATAWPPIPPRTPMPAGPAESLTGRNTTPTRYRSRGTGSP